MSSYEIKARELAVDLVNIGALKFGDFKMKVGLNSPIYFDLRVIISHPSLLIKLADLLIEVIGSDIPYDHLCGVPYTALPIATLISAKQNVPMLMRRKEAKAYGTKKLIEGQFKLGQRCLIVEDVVTSGSSVLETVNDLRKEGLEVTDAVVVLDREQGGYENLRKNGIKIHSLFTLRSILNELAKTATVPQADLDRSYKYLDNNSQIQVKLKSSYSDVDRLSMSFEERSSRTKSSIAKKLLNIMVEKKSILCVAADTVNSEKLLKLAESVAPYICILKTHIDIVNDFKPDLLSRLKELADKHNFLILEDRKFADIGNTVKLQYESGIYNISNWSDLVTAHALPGPGILKALKTSSDKGVFLLAEMSSEGTLTNSDYAKEAIKIAEADPELVIGIVCQSKDLIKNPGLIQLTPGVKLSSSGDSLGQQYNTPFKVVLERGADVAVVGRGISESENPAEVAKTYRDALWEAYLKRIGSKND